MAKRATTEAAGPEATADPADDGTGADQGAGNGDQPQRTRRPKAVPFDLDGWVDGVLVEKFGRYEDSDNQCVAGKLVVNQVALEAAKALFRALGDPKRPGSAEAIRSIQTWRREVKKHGSLLF